MSTWPRRTKHKFGAKPTVSDGVRFDSKIEERYYQYLKRLKEDGRVVFFLRQTPIHLASGTKLVIDFTVFCTDGTVLFVDVKGIETPVFKIKKKAVEHEYPLRVTIAKKVPTYLPPDRDPRTTNELFGCQGKT